MLQRAVLGFLLIIITAIAAGKGLPDYSQKDFNNEYVIAIHWMQQSPEFRALMYQGFNIAADQLKEEMTQYSAKKKPAIVVDIDDTLIGSTPYFASFIGTHDVLTNERSARWWGDWRNTQHALPGAVDFVNYAAKLGVEVFYISGRFDAMLPATINALKHNDFPFADAQHIYLQPATGTVLSKQARREHISNRGYNVIMLLGDQLEDMDEPSGTLYQNHLQWVDTHASHFGKNWVAFPNPLYGKWEDALSGHYCKSSPAIKHQLRLERLHLHLAASGDLLLHQHMIQAAIWQNFSGMYRALTYQAYNQASWQLAKIKKGNAEPPAIVVDIDGTVLSITDEIELLNLNCPTEITDRKQRKLLRADNALISGAKGFLNKAQANGFEVFYITNRPSTSRKARKNTNDILQATIANLKKHGLPNADTDHILSNEATPVTNSSPVCKAARIKRIEKGHATGTRYQVVMFVGDNLGDFDLHEKNLNPSLLETAHTIRSLFGRKYIVIPNVLSMPELRAAHRAAANTDDLCSLPPEALAKLRINQLKRWPDTQILNN